MPETTMTFARALELRSYAEESGVQVDAIRLRHPDSVMNGSRAYYYLEVRCADGLAPRDIMGGEELERLIEVMRLCDHKTIQLDTTDDMRRVAVRCVNCGTALEYKPQQGYGWLESQLPQTLLSVREALRRQELEPRPEPS